MDNPPHEENEFDAALNGKRGEAAWGSAVLAMVHLQARSMVDQLHVFGTKGAKALNARGDILLSTR